MVPSVDQADHISVGVAVLPDHAGDATRLLRCADRALYLAKKNGRDRVEVAQVDDREPTRDRRAPATRHTRSRRSGTGSYRSGRSSARFGADRPPLTSRTAPVTNPAAGDAR